MYASREGSGKYGYLCQPIPPLLDCDKAISTIISCAGPLIAVSTCTLLHMKVKFAYNNLVL